MDLYSIYPKQFRNIKIPIEKDRCFVLMPFSENYDKLYGTIKDTLLDLGINCYRDDEIFGPQPFMNKVLTEILRARYLIVILTDYRPNVLYELGIAHCFKDVQNVLILIEKKSQLNASIHDIAADLSHLTYIEYDINNISLIRSNIREFISENEFIFDFQDFLFNHNIVSIITENTNDFISFVKDNFKKNFSSLIDLLLKNPVMPQEKNKILEQCNTILYEQIDINGDYIDTMIKLWSECLIASNDTDIGEHYVQSFISDELIRSRFISENQKNKWKMDFVIYIAEQECFLTILLPWMINYLKRTKSSTIDLNRYKLESFLINTSITQIDEAMCNALREKDFHIREHLSDIIGEKHLSIAYSSLCAAIVNEPSLYAGKSIIVALGKIGLGKEQYAAEKIIDWLYDNLNRIIASGQDFTNSILTKSKNSILKLYPIYEDKFDLLFNEYITNKNY
jgi:hypothetical protein